MNVLVIGGGKVGYYLSKTLMEHGHVPIIVEKNKERCQYLANQFNMKVFHGDGSNIDMLQLAGAEKVEALVSVTGTDEDNLIICQLAKRCFNVGRTVARVNNPKNTDVMKRLGVDITVSSTNALANIIEREVDTSSMRQLMQLNRGKSTLMELTIPKDFKLQGIPLMNIDLPEESIIVSITRDEDMIIPRGNAVFLPNDRVLVVCKDSVVHELCQTLGLNER